MKIPNFASSNHDGSGLVSRESQFGLYLVSHSVNGQEIATKQAKRVAVNIVIVNLDAIRIHKYCIGVNWDFVVTWCMNKGSGYSCIIWTSIYNYWIEPSSLCCHNWLDLIYMPRNYSNSILCGFKSTLYKNNAYCEELNIIIIFTRSYIIHNIMSSCFPGTGWFGMRFSNLSTNAHLSYTVQLSIEGQKWHGDLNGAVWISLSGYITIIAKQRNLWTTSQLYIPKHHCKLVFLSESTIHSSCIWMIGVPGNRVKEWWWQ